MSDSTFDYRKSIQAINYFVRKFPDVRLNKMKALKLLWAADRFHLRKYGRPIAEDTYVAMKYGPVPSATRDILENNSYLQTEVNYSGKYLVTDGYDLRSVSDPDLSVFSETDKEALDFAFANFGNLDIWPFCELTHDYPEWEKFKKELLSEEKLVVLMDYLDFFDNPNKKQDSFSLDAAIVKQSKAIYEENSRVKAPWSE